MFNPKIGSSGVFKLSSEYSNLISENQVLTVSAIRTIMDITNEGIDVFTNIYATVNLTYADYTNDLKAGVNIVVFTTGDSKTIYIPANRVLSDTITTGHTYSSTGIMIKLPHLPEDLDISSLLVDLKELVLNRLGVSSEILTTKISASVNVSDDEHNAAELIRNNLITNNTSNQNKVLELEQIIIRQQDIINNANTLSLATGV